MLKICVIFFCVLSMDPNHCQESNELTKYALHDARTRYARHRCWQQYPQADIKNYNDTADTHCFLQCFLYKMGLMDLETRGLDSQKFIDVWETVEEAFEEDFADDTCLDKFDFSEALSGKCSDCYRKLMEFRSNCLELFEFTFSGNSTWKSKKLNKKVGQSATEFCDFIDGENIVNKETSADEEEVVSLLSHYKEELLCIFKLFHYLDAYGRVDESEIVLSYQEANENSAESRAAIQTCSRRANAKYKTYYLGDLALELEKCLKTHSPAYDKVRKLRDETSRQY